MPTIDTLFGRPIRDYPIGGDANAPDDVIWRILVEDYDGEIEPVMSDFLANHASPDVDTLVIGNWGYDNSPDPIIDMLVDHKETLTGLKSLFVGDISYDENEISWIVNGDMGPILANFPQLEYLRIRGGNELSFSHTEHQNLKHLIIESGGLDSGLLDTVSKMKLPNLIELELWFGSDNYGFDGSIDTIKPFIFGHQESSDDQTPDASVVYLEFSEGTSNKFWEGTQDGAQLTTRWGKIGTNGQTKTKDFDDATAAIVALEKASKSKIKKGYVEVGSNESGYLFPKLERLGLCDCMFADEVASLLKEAPILEQLEHLNLSLGVMTDVGLAELIDNPYIRGIESINLDDNYISDGDLLDKLSALGPVVSASDQRNETDDLFEDYPDPYDFYVAVGE